MQISSKQSPISINDIDINNIVVSNKLPLSFKYFTDYKDSEKLIPLCIFCRQIIMDKINFDENRGICFLIKKIVFIKYWKF